MLQVLTRITQTVDGRDRGDHDDIAAFEQRLGRRQAHLLDVLVDRGVFFDEGVRRRHIGLGLVVVVVGDEVLDRVVGEEIAKLAVELRRQGLVGRQHDGRPLHSVDHVGDREGLARAGHPEQGHACLAVVQPFDQARDRRRLIAGGLRNGLFSWKVFFAIKRMIE